MKRTDAEYLEDMRQSLGCRTRHWSPCTGGNEVLCRRRNAAGSILVGWQCRRCGCFRVVQAAAVPNLSGLPDYDENLETKAYNEDLDRHRAEAEAAREEIRRSWWARYSAYLKTERWRKKSAMVVARDVTCQACLARPATQAHHLTYDHVGDEPLFDLKGVCEPCHEKITKMDRARRELNVTPLDGEQE